jgi:hypothetical protein
MRRGISSRFGAFIVERRLRLSYERMCCVYWRDFRFADGRLKVETYVEGWYFICSSLVLDKQNVLRSSRS